MSTALLIWGQTLPWPGTRLLVPSAHLSRIGHLMFFCRNVSMFPVKVCLGTGGIIPFKSRVVQALKKKKKKGTWGGIPFLGLGETGYTDDRRPGSVTALLGSGSALVVCQLCVTEGRSFNPPELSSSPQNPGK